MANQAFELAILLLLKDAASAGADRVSDHLCYMEYGFHLNLCKKALESNKNNNTLSTLRTC